HFPWLCKAIARRARRTGLPREDHEDARQETFFSLLEAVRDYDLLQMAQAGGCTFRTFLGRRAVDRFNDALKHLRRMDARQRSEREMTAALENPSQRQGVGAAVSIGTHSDDCDPAPAAQRRELAVLVRRVFNGLTPEQQLLWEAGAEGISVAELARMLGMT